MKRFQLEEEERRTLLEMGMGHPHPRVRRRAQGLVRLAQGLTQTQNMLYLPPYSPELNAIEILWKQAKYFWRRFLTLSGMALRDEVDALMRGFGIDYTITFR